MRREDITGRKFGKLTAIEFIDCHPTKGTIWKFRCDCGLYKIIKKSHITSGKITSCGCLRKNQLLKDISGQKFNHLTAISYSHSKNSETYWIFECDCKDKTRKIINSNLVKRGQIKSCSCLWRLARFEKLSGQKFHRWTAIKYIKSNKKGLAIWEFECSCLNKTRKMLLAKSVKNGDSKSCGCLLRELASKANTTHGQSGTRLYNSYASMKARCTNPKDSHYKLYGGRGIAVCNEWLDSFQSFYDWSIANGYTDNLEIDRIDNDGNYCPENCRWITHKENCNNTRNNILVSFNNKEMTVAQLSEKTGIEYKHLLFRVKQGWSIEDIVNENWIKNIQNPKNMLYTYGGKSLTVKQWSEYKKMKYPTLLKRLREYGWTLQQALDTPVRKSNRWPTS